MRLRFRLRTLLFVTLILALIFAVVAPDAYEALRRASGCYVLGDVVRPGRWTPWDEADGPGCDPGGRRPEAECSSGRHPTRAYHILR